MQGRHGRDIAQMKDFVGRLGGLQNEHQALKLREHLLLASSPHVRRSFGSADTGLSEEIMTFTRTDEFNRVLEIQQSACRSIVDLPCSC